MLHQAYRHVRWFGSQLAHQFIEHGCLNAAAALTYTTLFAVVPLMTVTYSMLSVLPEFSGAGEKISDFVFDTFLPESSSVVEQTLSNFSDQARQLTVAGVGILVVTAFMMLVTIEKAFNVIWRVPEPRRGLPRFFMYWGILTFGPPLLAGGVLASSYLLALPLVDDLDAFGVRKLLLSYLPIFASVATFTVLYKAVPNCFVSVRHALFGGVLTMILFEIAKQVFQEVIVRSDTQVIYGAFAVVPFFLMWLYLVWVLVLVGAISVRTLSLRRDDEVDDGEPLVVKCTRVLYLLYQSHLRGESVSDTEIAAAVSLTREQHEKIFAVLRDENLLRSTDDERWMLGRNLQGITLWDIYLRLPEALDVERLGAIDGMGAVKARLQSFAKFGNSELSVSFDELFAQSA